MLSSVRRNADLRCFTPVSRFYAGRVRSVRGRREAMARYRCTIAKTA